MDSHKKVCTKCGSNQNGFYFDVTKADGLSCQCITCKRGPRGSASNRKNNLKSKYGITPFQYDLILKSQGGVCKICGSPPGEKTLSVDHKHGTMRIRGLLCNNCNMGIGFFAENPDALMSAAAYLRGTNG